MSLTSTIIGDAPLSKKMHNHVIFLLDSSGSMHRHLKSVKKVFDETLKHLKATTTSDQELYISLYQFDHEIKNPVFNELLSTMRKEIKFYARGMTRLRDCLNVAINDHKVISKSNGDHSFLIYAITDGADNDSNMSNQSQMPEKHLPVAQQAPTQHRYALPGCRYQPKTTSYPR